MKLNRENLFTANVRNELTGLLIISSKIKLQYGNKNDARDIKEAIIKRN